MTENNGVPTSPHGGSISPGARRVVGALLIAACASPGGSAAPAWLPVPGEVQDAEVRAVHVDSEGAVWFGVTGSGLAGWDGEELSWTSTADGLATDRIADIGTDGDGRLWIAGVGGFSVRTSTGWRVGPSPGGIEPRVIFGMHVPRDGGMWLATSEGAARLPPGADPFRQDNWRVLGEDEGLPHPVVHAVATGSDGAVWFSTRAGLSRWDGDSIQVVNPGPNFRSSVSDEAGIWFGTTEGVLRWLDGNWIRELDGEVALPRLITDGSVWAASPGPVVHRRTDRGWERIRLPRRAGDAEVFDLAAGPDGSIWVATSAGAFRYAPPRAR